MYIFKNTVSPFFRERSYIFSNFVKYLSSTKIKNSGFPPDVKTEDEKLDYCKKLNKKMKFTHPSLGLSPKMITFDSIKKNCAKDALNSNNSSNYNMLFLNYVNYLGVLGKLSQDPNQGDSLILRSQMELEKILNNAAYEISDFSLIGEKLACVKVKRRQGYEQFSRRGNVILGAIVTGNSRIYMHENLLKIVEAGQIPLYTYVYIYIHVHIQHDTVIHMYVFSNFSLLF